MKKIKIGIPRSIYYYRYGILWKAFFTKLGCHVIISPETNDLLIELGKKNTKKETCLPYIQYIGHILYLSKNCDYILISKICDNKKTCSFINNIYDNINDLILKEQILKYNINNPKQIYEFIELLKLGFKITKNPIKIIYSYIIAKKKQKNYNLNKENEQKNKLYSNHKKILVVSNYYNIENKYTFDSLKEYIKNKKIELIYPHYLNKLDINLQADYFFKNINNNLNKELFGAIQYYQYQIDGIMIISNTNCSIDKITNSIINYKITNIPTINIIIDKNILKMNKDLEEFIKEIIYQ